MPDEPVTIVDREVLKVLSADTRIDILKILSDGQRTPSFVAKKLKKSDATIVEHLQMLEKVGLVKKTVSPGKKWVFYSLTERGQGIISSKSRRLVIILATSLIFMMAGFGSFAGHLYTAGTFGPQMAAERAAGVQVPEANFTVPIDDVMIVVTKSQFLLYTSIILLAASLSGLGFYLYKKSKFKVMRI